MPDLVGVVFAADLLEPAPVVGSAGGDGGSHRISEAVATLIGAGAIDVTIWTPSPHRVKHALRGRRFRGRRRIRAWDPTDGYAHAFLRMQDRLQGADVLVADDVHAHTNPLVVPAGSSNCILFVDSEPVQARRVDLIEIEYVDGRNPGQFAVHSIGDHGSYGHTGFTFFPLTLIETIQVMGVKRELARRSRDSELTRMLYRVRRKSRRGQLRDAKGLTIFDLVTQYMTLGQLTAVKG